MDVASLPIFPGPLTCSPRFLPESSGSYCNSRDESTQPLCSPSQQLSKVCVRQRKKHFNVCNARGTVYTPFWCCVSLGWETALGNEGLRGSIVSFSDVAHHSLPFAYILHSGSGGMETATPPAPVARHRWTGGLFEQILGGMIAHREKGWVRVCVGKVGQRGRGGRETRVNMNWEDFQSRQRAWKRTGFEFCMFF